MTSDPAILKPTQADREAAADLAELAERLALGGNDAAAIRNGIWDDDLGDMGRFVQRVARHALASRPPQGGEVATYLQGELARAKDTPEMRISILRHAISQAVAALTAGEVAPT